MLLPPLILLSLGLFPYSELPLSGSNMVADNNSNVKAHVHEAADAEAEAKAATDTDVNDDTDADAIDD